MPSVVEFRVPLPLTVNEFERAWLFMCIEASCDATAECQGEGDEGVVILKNEPFDNTNGQLGEISVISGKPIPKTKGQYTLKEYRLASKAPMFARAVLPAKSLILVEESFNAYPNCLTYLTNAWLSKKKFYISVSTTFLPGNCTEENAQQLDAKKLKKRKIINIDLAKQDKESDDYRTHLDPATFQSQATGRGPLEIGKWMETADPCMTAYKVVEVCCDSLWPAGGKAERSIISGQEDSFTNTHARAFCTIDKWFGLSMEDIRMLETICEEVLAKEVARRKIEQEQEQEENEPDKKKKGRRLSLTKKKKATKKSKAKKKAEETKAGGDMVENNNDVLVEENLLFKSIMDEFQQKKITLAEDLERTNVVVLDPDADADADAASGVHVEAAGETKTSSSNTDERVALPSSPTAPASSIVPPVEL